MVILSRGCHFFDKKLFCSNILRDIQKSVSKRFGVILDHKRFEKVIFASCDIFATQESYGFWESRSRRLDDISKLFFFEKSEPQLPRTLSRRILGRFLWNSTRLKAHGYPLKNYHKTFCWNFFIYLLLMLRLIYIYIYIYYVVRNCLEDCRWALRKATP